MGTVGKVTLGGVLGASAFNAYQNQNEDGSSNSSIYKILVDPFSIFRNMQNQNGQNAQNNNSSNNKESGIQRDLDELKRLIFQQRQQPLYINGQPSNLGNLKLMAIPVSVLALYLLYLKIFRGWSIFDMMVVTKASLKQSVSQVTDGIEHLQQKLQKTRQYLQEQLQNLTIRQDQTIKQQQELSDNVKNIGSDVDKTRQDVAKVHYSVEDLNMQVSDMNTLTQYTTNGIFLLCNAVSDLMKQTRQFSNPSYEMLSQYLKKTPPQKQQGIDYNSYSRSKQQQQIDFDKFSDDFSYEPSTSSSQKMSLQKELQKEDHNLYQRSQSTLSQPSKSQGLGGLLFTREYSNK